MGPLTLYGRTSLLLAAIAFFIYIPSLTSDFVFDARTEILEEGFITSSSNLPAVLSLKVLGMNIMLEHRPGQLLYLMLVAMISGKNPIGYHLGSDLLHAGNVALLFVLLRRLSQEDRSELVRKNGAKTTCGAAIAALIFAVHPLAVESVAEISYSSTLLATLFTLLGLIAATSFRPDDLKNAVPMGCAGVFCAFASVACKESGLATPLLLMTYWVLFRRGERGAPWFGFLSAAMVVTIAFLLARFLLVPAGIKASVPYLGGSFFQVFLIQPRLWVFMMSKLVWPTQLSADYTLQNVDGLSTLLAFGILVVVLVAQIYLSTKSRLGAFGVAVYWLGLAAVSNFFPLYRILGDRFYYLPLAGMVMQLLALFLMLPLSGRGMGLTILSSALTILLLATLTLKREKVFKSNLALFSDTVRVSPFSWVAHNGLGAALYDKGDIEDAMAHFHQAALINPNNGEALYNTGNAFLWQGRQEEAIHAYESSLEIDSNYANAHLNLGVALLQKGLLNEAEAHFRRASAIEPRLAEAHYNLGVALLEKGSTGEAITELQTAVKITPDYTDARSKLASTFLENGQSSEAIAQYEEILKQDPQRISARNNLGIALVRVGRLPEAVKQFQEAVRLDPADTEAEENLAKAQKLLDQSPDAR